MRIVIKIGSNVLVDSSGRISRKRVRNLTDDIAALFGDGHEVVVVTSGAIAAGRNALPKLDLPLKRKVWAAAGQPVLMRIYSDEFGRHKISVGQLLLARRDFGSQELYRYFISTMESLFRSKVLPILNENDVTVVEDLSFGDNDALASLVAQSLHADKLVLLTDQKGLFDGDPARNKKAGLISRVSKIDKKLFKQCAAGVSRHGTGGMASKVMAAKDAMDRGITVHIADGRRQGILNKIIKGGNAGTVFIPHKKI